jgi:hypothetical protein
MLISGAASRHKCFTKRAEYYANLILEFELDVGGPQVYGGIRRWTPAESVFDAKHPFNCAAPTWAVKTGRC